EASMRRIILSAVTLVLAMVIHAQSQTLQSKSSAPKSDSNGQGSRSAPAKGTLLVKKLPDGIKGVTIKNGMVRLLPGYKFVRHSDGTITVDESKGGGGASKTTGTWSCACAEKGLCAAITNDNGLSCVKTEKNPCSGPCRLTVT